MKKRLYLLAVLFLGLSGCVKIDGLREAAKAVDDLREQVKSMTGEHGDLDRLLETARKDIDYLIKEAEKSGDRLEEKVVLDLIKVRKDLILEATALVKKSNLALKGTLLDVTGDFARTMDRLPRDVGDSLAPLILALPSLSVSPPVRMRGTEITFLREGHYPLSFDLRQAANLVVRLDHGALYRPNNPMDTRIAIEIPAASLAGKFRDQEREFIPIELVDRNNPGFVRYFGSLELKPLFGVKYSLIERGPKGQVRPLVVDEGSAILDILTAATDAMKSANAPPLEIAQRHGQIYHAAKARLPYGSSNVDLSPEFDDFEMVVTPEHGPPRTLNRTTRRYREVSLSWDDFVRPDGKTVQRLTIQVDAPQS